MTKIIKNNEFVRSKLQECLKPHLTIADEDAQFLAQLETLLNEDYLTMEFIKRFKTFWNQHFKGKK